MRSNMIFRTGSESELISQAQLNNDIEAEEDLASAMKVNLMCVSQDKWHQICELYPETYQRLKDQAIVKREIILHFMEKNIELDQIRNQTGIPAALSSRRDPKVVTTPK